jgi:predicted RNase H-like HicB family nuclease
VPYPWFCKRGGFDFSPLTILSYDESMTTRDFRVFLEPDEDYGGYIVVCPSIPGCYSQGKTVPEALANIREAIDLCLEDIESAPSW